MLGCNLIIPWTNDEVWIFSYHITERALKVYDHNVVCTVLLLSINQTLEETGKLQRLSFLLQTVFVVCQKKNLMCRLWVSDHWDH